MKAQEKVVKVTKAEFWLEDGHHVVFDITSHYVTMYRHAHHSRTIKTPKLPSIINAQWLVKNYPTKILEDK